MSRKEKLNLIINLAYEIQKLEYFKRLLIKYD